MLEITRVLDMDGAVNWDSFNYLGVPIFKSKSKTSPWLPIVEKVKKKVMGWGAVWLNLAGKVVLIKVVLNNYMLYQCSLLLAPAQIINQIEGLMRNFLWQGGNIGWGGCGICFGKLENHQTALVRGWPSHKRLENSKFGYRSQVTMEFVGAQTFLEQLCAKKKIFPRSKT